MISRMSRHWIQFKIICGEIWTIWKHLTKKILFWKSSRTDGPIDEVVNAAWYKRTYEECKTIAGVKDFMIWKFIFTVTRL